MNGLPGTPVMNDETTPPPEEGAPPAKAKINWWHEIRGLLLMLLAVMAFHTFIAKPFYIPSGSMVPSLLVGDRLVVSKYPYGWSWVSASFPFHLLPRSDWRLAPATPEYGDIVIVVPPNSSEDYIKRVVALPGDRIAVVEGRIVLNGKPIRREMEPPLRIPADHQMCGGIACLADFDEYRVQLPNGTTVYEPPTYRETLPNGATYSVIDYLRRDLDNYPETLVPEGHVFVMGDNRDHSADSRASVFEKGLDGPVPISSVGGRAEFITFSLDGSTTLNPLTWWNSLRSGRAWTSLRPARATRAGAGE